MKVSELKERYSIVNIVERYIDLEHVYGDEYKGLCPFHDDHTPSLTVNVDKGVYHCPSCKASGDMIDFVKDIESVKFIDAIEIITGDSLGNESIVFDKKSTKQDSLLCLVDSKEKTTINESLLEDYCQYTHQYLLDKNFPKDILEEYQVGYSYDNCDPLYNRVTYPWRNLDGDLVAIAGRDVTDTKDAKYKTKKGGDKSNTFFNAYRVSKMNTHSVIVVEDEKSVVRLAQFGFKNAVALGNNDLGERKWILRQLADTAILAYDSDKKGREGRNKAIKQLMPIMNVEVIKLEGYKDIGDIEDRETFMPFYNDRDKL